MKIQTSFDYPAIPIRNMDWSAVDADTYDADCDQDGFFSTCPIGHGATEREAIDDLLEQLSDEGASTSTAMLLHPSNHNIIGAVQ